MASTLLSSVMSSSSGGGLIFPSVPMYQGQTNIKDGSTTNYVDTSSSFYGQLEISHTKEGFETATLQHAANTNEQTIVDVSGSGVLTNIMTCALSSPGVGDIIIRITIDGQETAITTTTQSLDQKVLMGGFRSNEPSSNSGNTIGGANDLGFLSDPSQREFQMLTPIQVIQEGVVGMVFKESLKVTIQGSINLSAGGISNKCVVGYFASIPEGL